MRSPTPVEGWLLDPEASDPSIRWQVMRDLLDLPEARWALERARVETEGWGARLLALEDDDGQWAGGAYFPADFVWGGSEPGQPWTATSHSLTRLREFWLDPLSERARRMVELIGQNARWEHDGQRYWEGEVEPCINGQVVANGAYFGLDVGVLVDRLVTERLEDGGWNCEAERGSVRSSFDTTINVLEGLLEHERASGGTVASRAARGPHAGRTRVGRGVPADAIAVPTAEHRQARRRGLPGTGLPHALALRRAACARLLPFSQPARR